MTPTNAAAAGRPRADHSDPANPAASPSLEDRVGELEWRRSAEVESRLGRALGLEREATAHGATTVAMRARLVAADMLHRVGRVSDAASRAGEVNRWAAAHTAQGVLARSHLVLSSIFEGIGDAASALDHALQAMALDDGASPRTRGIHTLRLADALVQNGSADQARVRYREAASLFEAVGEEALMGSLLNNLALMECEAGDVAAGMAAVGALLARIGDDLDPALADTVARIHLAAGDLDAAERMLDLGGRLLDELGDVQAMTPAELSLTRARVLLARNRPADALSEVERCLGLCGRRGLGGTRVEALEVQSQAHALQGRFDRAYHAHRAFHAASEALRGQRRETAARTRQALFETEEARRAARVFWEQARVDGLTGLRNRRFVDESLPAFLRRVGSGVVVAILDIDHFKRVNDTFTHALGDQVLQRIAGMLSSVVPAHGTDGTPEADQGFAARLGGEEFVVVLTCADPRDAVRRLDDLRVRVAGHPWSELADGLGVTVSIGASVAVAEDTQRTLLSRADHHLYAAKRAGRNRLVSDLPDRV